MWDIWKGIGNKVKNIILVKELDFNKITIYIPILNIKEKINISINHNLNIYKNNKYKLILKTRMIKQKFTKNVNTSKNTSIKYKNIQHKHIEL